MRQLGIKNFVQYLNFPSLTIVATIACFGFLAVSPANSQESSENSAVDFSKAHSHVPTPAPRQASRSSSQVGKAVQVVNRVTGNIKDDVRTLANNDPVYGLERISADAQSHGEIILNDDSRILVGPGAEISLDEFILADSGIKSATLNVLKGAFRFISGKSKQGTFKIKTPVATIGMRGTLFDVYVGEDGQTDVILFSGRVNEVVLPFRTVLRLC